MNKQRGFTLIEILIAIVVFSIGLLGLAGLQLTSFRNVHDAHLRSVATLMAYDMADRMRANRVAFLAGGYDDPNAVTDADCTQAAGCTPANLAQNDFAEWTTTLAATLPQGAGEVCIDSTPNDGIPAATACDGVGTISVVKVWWTDELNGEQRFTTSFQP